MRSILEVRFVYLAQMGWGFLGCSLPRCEPSIFLARILPP